MQKTSIIVLFSALAVGLVLAGLWVAGGPATGAAERRDEARLSDLGELRDLTFCLAETAEGVLPDTIDMSETCQRDIALSDPYTDAPYVYEKVSARAFKWCAGFEYPDRVTTYWAGKLDPETGCIQYTYRP